MTSMTKENLIVYLKDYANIQVLVIKNPSIKIWNIYVDYMNKTNRSHYNLSEYYVIMLRVFQSYTFLKSFSILEDFLLNRDDFIDNEEINFIKNECNFSTNSNYISNKKIIQLIRNAFNHNDDKNFDRFKFSVNAKNFEVEFKDIRSKKELINNVPIKPVKFKISSHNLLNIYQAIKEKNQNLIFVSYDIPKDFDINSKNLFNNLDNIFVNRYYFTKKLSSETIDKFKSLCDVEGLSKDKLYERSELVHKYASEITPISKLQLNSEQKIKIIDYINKYKINNEKFLSDDIYPVLSYFISKVVPIPYFKFFTLDNQSYYTSLYITDTDLSFNKILEIVCNSLRNDANIENYNELEIERHEILKNKSNRFKMEFLKDVIDGEFTQLFPIIMYIDAVINSCCDDEYIVINKNSYSKEKVRNSLVHMRWFISEKKELVLYDADPKNINDYKLELIGKIDIEDLEIWADNLMEKNVTNKYVK